MVSNVAISDFVALERQHKDLCFYVKSNTKWKETLLFHMAKIEKERHEEAVKMPKHKPYNAKHILEKNPFAMCQEIAVLYAHIKQTHENLVNPPRKLQPRKITFSKANRYAVLLDILNVTFKERIERIEAKQQTINKMIDHLSVQGLESPEAFHNFTTRLLFHRKLSANNEKSSIK